MMPSTKERVAKMNQGRFSIETVHTTHGFEFRIVESKTGTIYAIAYGSFQAEGILKLANSIW